MTDTKLLEQISKSVEAAIKDAFKELGIESKVKVDNQNAFKKTEQILWNYPMFKDVIQNKYEQIEEIKKYGVPTKSKSILEYQSGGSISQGLETTDEIISGAVNNIMEDINWLKNAIYKIDRALDSIKTDDTNNIIKRYYFDKESLNELAISLKVEASTVSKWKNKLVRKVSVYLFPKDVVSDLLEVES